MKEKWKTLKHNGILFPKPYEYRQYKVIVSGKECILPEKAEEMAYNWAAKLETPYVDDKVFQKNFWEDFKEELPQELKKTKFPIDWDLWPIHKDIQKRKEEKKAVPKAARDKEKEERDKLKAIYGKAILNGIEVELGNYIVEPAGIFMGRGEHPKRGRWKVQAQPEDITINISKNESPPSPPAGHSWKAIVENKGAYYAAMWIESLTGVQKKILFAANSFVKQNSDKKKFEHAITLANNFDKVTAFIWKNLESDNKSTREIATVCELIRILSIRVGDERDLDEQADTRGATSLCAEDIKINDNSVSIDFIGKDSILFHSTTQMSDAMVKNLKEFSNGKKKSDKLFTHVSSADVRDFLGQIIPGLSAKQFRTATGSTLLAEALKNNPVDPALKENRKLEVFTNANLAVALKLNHQSAVSEAYDNSLDKMKSTLRAVKEEYKIIKTSINSDIKKLEEQRDNDIEFFKQKREGDKLKESVKRVKGNCKKKSESLQNKLSKLKEKIDILQLKIDIKEKTRGIALGTSKGAYSDPRIPISWCKDNKVNVKRVYPETMQKKFAWALDVDADFYKKYPKVE